MTSSRTSWADSGIEQIADSVFRIPLPLPNDGLRAVNTYAVTGPDGLSMIDAGWSLAESEQVLAAALESIGFGLADVSQFLVTHAHRDHYTQAVAVRRLFGARISIGIGEQPTLERLTGNDVDRAAPAVLRRAGATDEIAGFLADPPSLTRSEWELPDHWLQDRDKVDLRGHGLTVIATPGHTSGHVVFHDEAAALLFAGDHVLPHITPSIGLQPVLADFPLRDYIDSLRLTLSLPDAMLLPAHGPVTSSAHARVHELLAHHDKRLAEMAAIAAGGATARQVAGKIGWTRRDTPLADLDQFNRRLAICETLAHLDVLALRGELTATTRPDGSEFYHAP